MWIPIVRVPSWRFHCGNPLWEFHCVDSQGPDFIAGIVFQTDGGKAYTYYVLRENEYYNVTV